MNTLLTAREVVLDKGDAPLNFEAGEGLTVLRATRESGASTLAMALAGRARHHSGTIALDGDASPRQRFRHTALAGVPLIDSLERSVPARSVIREQVALASPFFARVPKDILGHDLVAPWLAPLALEHLKDLDPDTQVGQLDVLTRFKLRVLLALIARPEAKLLIVDDPDQLKDMGLVDEMVGVLRDVAKQKPVLTLSANAEVTNR